MNESLKYFRAFPSVVEADKESEITIKCIDGTFMFYDDLTYDIQFIPQDMSDVPLDDIMSLQGYNKFRKTYTVQPENGEIKLKYTFFGEQEWHIHISCKDYSKHQHPMYDKHIPHWNALIEKPAKGIDVSIYSLKEDLYNKKPLKGDLHIHTYVSDGRESPEMVSAYYRKAGHDFIALSDHNAYNTAKYVKDKLDFVKNYNIMVAEEVHNGYLGFYHMVNIFAIVCFSDNANVVIFFHDAV